MGDDQHQQAKHVIARRVNRHPPEVWERAIAAYLAGATAAEVAARYGVAAHSIYQRVTGKGKRKRWAEGRLASSASPAPGGGGGGRGRAAGGDVELYDIAPHTLPSPPEGERDDSAAGLSASPAPGGGGGGRGRASGGDVELYDISPHPLPPPPLGEGDQRRITTRRHHAPELWVQARRDYEVGHFTAPVIAERYGMTGHAVKGRARREGWSKLVRVAPAPLLEPPPAGEVETVAGETMSAWEKIAHEAQRPPSGAWSTWLFQGGRGAGKTRAGAEWLAARAEAAPGLFALVGPTQHDVREVMIDGPSGLRQLPGRERPWYERSRRRLLWSNGSVAYAFSAEEPERLRGPQFEAAWADEFCIWPRPSETLAILRMGLRRGTSPQLVVTTTPKPIPALRLLRAEPSCVVTQAATVTNAENLAPTFLDGLAALYGGTRLAAQELEGLMLDGEGALWRAEDLARARGPRPPELGRVVVGVDPPAGHAGAACGIVAAARAGQRAYVLADRSAAGLSPLGWATRVVETAREFGAAEIVAEANQGGDMVRAVLASAGAPCAVRLVHASQGKRTRAEPIAALYEQGRVTHCGAFAALEEEMLALGVSESEGLLDRADALVWALTALMQGPERLGPRITQL